MNAIMIILAALIISGVVLIIIFSKKGKTKFPGYSRPASPDQWEGFLADFKVREFKSYSQLMDFLYENSGKINYYSQSSDFKTAFETGLQNKKSKLAS